MKVAVSLFKSKMAHYLRLIKSGEEVEILERGVPIACVTSTKSSSEELIIKAQQPIEKLTTKIFSTKLSKKECDVVKILTDERNKR